MTATADFAIDVRHASKTYRRRVQALRDLSLTVHRGEIFGLLGPNGAGKSTLVKILMTVIRPTRCEGTLLGRRIGEKPTLKRVGYLPEHLRFPGYLKGGQAIDYFGALSLVPRAERRRRAGELLELVGMSTWAGHAIVSYSKGMRQRLGLAVAMIADPDLLLLDEPTDGVDPVGRKEIRDVLLELRARGKTVFLNSHLLGELEMICDRVAIMSKGSVVRQGSIAGLTEGTRRYEFVVGPLGSTRDLTRRLEALGVRIGPSLPDGSTALELGSADAEIAQPVVDLLRADGVPIVSMRPVRQSLEDFFIETIRDSGDASPGAVMGKAPRSAPPTRLPSEGGA